MNVREPDGAERWVEADRPTVPSLLVRGVASPILHVSQLASLLGHRPPAQLEASSLAWDCAAVLGAWVQLIRPLDFETLTAPTPSRGRSPRNLTVNVFHPFEILPLAFDTGHFEWDPTLDDEREVGLRDQVAVVGYAAERHLTWQAWLLDRQPDLRARDPDVSSPRGRVTYANLIASQRWHAAFHYRQLLAFLAGRGHDPVGAFSLAGLPGLELPADIF